MITIIRTQRIIVEGGPESKVVGGLPSSGDLQPILDAKEGELFDAAQINNDVFSRLDHRWVRYEAKVFIQENPNARLLLSLELADLEATIENRTENQETLLLKTLSLAVRFLYSIYDEN